MKTTTGFLRHFHACNAHNMENFVPFMLDGQDYGWISHATAKPLLAAHPEFVRTDRGITLAPDPLTFAARSALFHNATQTLAAHYGKKLRHEMYPVLAAWGDEPLAQIDRSAVPWFGVRAFGVHVNGYVRKADGIYLWIGERAADRSVDPGMLDNMIGGGQPIGLSIRENLGKEAHEEAGLPAALIAHAVHARTLRYKLERHAGLRNDTLFVFDIEMPADVTPTNTDGEVAAFHLIPARDVTRIIHDTDKFKFNCNMVIIDFLIRHGIITAAHPEYADLIAQLPPAHTLDIFR